MTSPIFIKSFRAGITAIAGYLILKAVNGGTVAVATSSADPLVGAAGSMGAPAEGMVDIAQGGWSEVRCGGDISFGDPLTAGAAGKAIKAVPTAGVSVRIIGFAMSDGSDGDIIPFNIAPGFLAKPAAA